MTIAIGGRNISVGILIAALGGVLGILQAVLTWESVSYGPALASMMSGSQTSVVGLDANQGKVILVLGIVAIALAGAVIANVKIPNVSAILVVVGAIMIGFALIGLNNAMSDMNKFNDSLAIIKGLADTTGASLSMGIGLILAAVSGVLVLVGGGLGLMKKAA